MLLRSSTERERAEGTQLNKNKMCVRVRSQLHKQIETGHLDISLSNGMTNTIEAPALPIFKLKWMEVWEGSSLFPRRKPAILHYQYIWVSCQRLWREEMHTLSWIYPDATWFAPVQRPRDGNKWGSSLGGGPLILGNLCSITKHILFSSTNSPLVSQRREVRNSTRVSQRRWGMDIIVAKVENLPQFCQ